MYATLAVLAAFAFVYSVVASRLERTPLSGPVIFLAFGAVAGPDVLGWLDLSVEGEVLRTVAELTLALVLFTDSANADLATLRRSFRIPQRLLLIGLPLTIALGCAAAALIFPHLPLISVAVLATMLAPTDAALGEAVVTNRAVPGPIREGLNVESGLNDGICVPILFTFLALAGGTEGSTGGIALRLIAEEIGIGLAVGVGLSAVGSRVIAAASARGWIEEPWTQLPVIGLALTCFALAQATGGSGFIACFSAGLTFGGLTKQHKERLLNGAEGGGNLLALLTWVIFGAAAVIPVAAAHLDWRVVVYALLSLTVVRMLPVGLCLLGLGLRSDARLFLGWFGPRGLASIVFAVIAANQGVTGSGTLVATVVCTVTLSILAHGLTANPLSSAYAARARTDPGLRDPSQSGSEPIR
jgi:NhaP-type Na+/H+ or K+/H+ antiporter